MITSRAVLLKQALSATHLDDVIVASQASNNNDNFAQQLSQRLQCHPDLRPHTFTVGENCSVQALEYAHQQLTLTPKSLILISGIETSKTPSISFNPELSQWISDWKNSQGLNKKLKVLNTLHTRHFRRESSNTQEKNHYYSLYKELAEKTANYYSLSTEAMAEYVKLSQRRLKVCTAQ